MKKKYFILILAILFPCLHYAQVSNINWGEDYIQRAGKPLVQTYLGHTDEHYFIFNHPFKDKYLFKYGYDHILKKVTPIDFKVDKSKLTKIKLLKTQSGCFLTAAFINKDEYKRDFYTFKLNKEGDVKENLRKVCSQDYDDVIMMVGADELNKDKEFLKVSEDGSKALLTSVTKKKRLRWKARIRAL